MPVSEAYKALLDEDTWASSPSAFKQSPEDVGIDRADGWGLAYEQIGTGKFPERGVFNTLIHELHSFVKDCSAFGVHPWSDVQNFAPSDGNAAFSMTPSGIWYTFTSTGPAFGNATDPDSVGQTIWRRF